MNVQCHLNVSALSTFVESKLLRDGFVTFSSPMINNNTFELRLCPCKAMNVLQIPFAAHIWLTFLNKQTENRNISV